MDTTKRREWTSQKHFKERLENKMKNDLQEDPKSFRRLIGKLMYLTIIRPDITFVVQCLSQYMHQPKNSHMRAALRIVRYIKGQSGIGILLPSSSNFKLTTYCDSD